MREGPPIRMDLIENAIKFLQDPRVGGGNIDVKLAFLRHKGLTEGEVSEAMKLAHSPLIGKPTR